jgi:hypothetical protein
MRPIGTENSLKLESVAGAGMRLAGWYWWRDPYSATRLSAHLAGRKPLIFKRERFVMRGRRETRLRARAASTIDIVSSKLRPLYLIKRRM